MPADVDAQELLAAIAPLVVRSEAEQERFWEKQETYSLLLARSLPAKVADVSDTTKIGETKATDSEDETPPSRRPYIVGGVLLAILLAASLWWWQRPDQVTDEPVQASPTDTVQLIRGCRDTLARNYDPLATADCDNCCLYEPLERVGCRNTTALNYDPKATTDCDGCCQFIERDNITKLIQRDSVSWKPTPPRFEVALPPLTALPDSGWRWLARYKQWLSWLIPLLTLALAFVWWLWRRARQEYIARQSRNDEPPYRLPIKIRRQEAVTFDERFFLLLDRLRGREMDERLKIDLPGTIKATARRGGFPELRFRAFTRPTEYLILIDQQSEQGHQSQLFEHIYQHFVQQEVYAERFFFDGNPKLCWNDRYPKGVSLAQLRQRYSQARLLIFADGYSFLNPASGELESWAKQLTGWQQRALLTPAPVGDWNYREATLHDAFLVLPTSVGGMLQLVQHFEDRATPSLREWKYERAAEDKNVRIDETRVVADLEAQMPAHLLPWIAGCAIYPELHWDLTLEVGQALRGEEGPKIPFADIRELARLPWFKRGHMPQHVREQLLESDLLSREEEEKVRTAIIDVLLANAPENNNSYAYDEHQLHLALNQVLVSQLPEDRQRWLERYRELHQRGVQEDMVSMAALDRQYNRRLDFLLPRQLMQQLFSSGRPVLGWRSAVPLIVALLLGVLGWGAVRMLPDPCEGQRVQLPGDDTTYCLANAADTLSYYAHLGVNALENGRPEDMYAVVDSVFRLQIVDLFIQPQRFANDSLLFLNFFQPILNTFWNQGQAHFQAQHFQEAAATFGQYDELIERVRSIIESQSDLIGTQPNRTDRLHWRGMASIFAGDRRNADRIESDLIDLPAPSSATAIPYPNLTTYLRYPFVDSVAYGRIRVRSEKGSYGFLHADTGEPTWEGTNAQAPYDYAENYRVDTLRGDTLAMVYLNGQQCLYKLDENPDNAICFTQLRRFQNQNTGLYGFETETTFALIPAQFENAGEFTDDGLAWVKRPDEDYGYIRSDGNDLLPQNDLEDARDFYFGRAAVAQNNRWGFLDANGTMVIEARYNSVGDFEVNGQAQVLLDGKRFFIDKSGKCVGGDCPTLGYQGRIIGSLSNEPIVGAELRIDRLPEQQLTTDAQGYYTFTLPESESPQGWPVRILSGDGPLGVFNITITDADTDPITLQTYTLPQEAAAAPDDDQDGVPNTEDRCPEKPGSPELRGCPDEDGDNIPDIDDRCPQAAGVADNQGCPPPSEGGAGGGSSRPISPQMITIPGGTFTMGDEMGDNEQTDETPHTVSVSTFKLSRTEVTFAEYDAFCEATGQEKPDDEGWGRDRRPVIKISWFDAVAYCNWLSEQEGYTPVYTIESDNVQANWSANGYRLPTEAEWEYAARQGGEKVRFGNGKDIADPAEINFNGSEAYKKAYSIVGEYRRKAVPVGSLNSPNGLGLHDMSGNVWEWCWDWYDSDYYDNSPSNNPRGPSETGSYRVNRGGGWTGLPRFCRAAYRYRNGPTHRNSGIGFRLARS